MIQISKQQVLKKFDALPQNLKEALFSEHNANLLWQICGGQHLTEDKISVIATIAGDVILGFIHAEDLAKEIKNELGINQEIANTIALEIDRKIFGPIRNDLEKVYSMPAEEKEIEAEALDLRKKTAEQRLEEAVVPAAEAGVSGKTEVKSVAESVSAGAEGPKIVGAEEKPIVGEKIEKKKEKIENLSAEMAEAGPMIIHKEAEFKPLSADKKSLGGLFGFLRKDKERKSEAITAAKAQVELGGQPLEEQGAGFGQQPAETEAPKVARTEIPKVRVVHYSEVPMPTNPFPEEGVVGSELKTASDQPGSLENKKIFGKDKEIEVKPPENLPTGMKIPGQQTTVPQKKAEPLEKQPDRVISEQTLNLRKPPIEIKETKPAAGGLTPEIPVPEKKFPTPAESRGGEESEMIDLTTFKKI